MARRIYTDYQGAADRIQARGHGPTHSINVSGQIRRIKPTADSSPCGLFCVSILDRLMEQAPAVVWMLGIRDPELVR